MAGVDAGKTGAETSNPKDIAIIGLAGSLPGADSLEGFCGLLMEGKHAIGPFPAGRAAWIEEHLRLKGARGPAPIFHPGAYLDRIDEFDHAFFGISPREAELMSPVQRLFLQTAWHALEDAGHAGSSLKGGDTGVFLGYIGDLDGYRYKEFVCEWEPNTVREIAAAGNLAAVIPARLSHFLDWHGPSLLVDTACSSSLVALHMACRSIRSGECPTALVASVRLNMMPLDDGFRLGIESRNGRILPFEEGADGTLSGEGSIAMLIKSLDQAIRDGDNIRAVIKGGAVNHDGRSAGLTAPNPRAQADVLVKAWKDADIAPETLSYLEAHGTATYVGDPVEVEGMSRAFARSTARKGFCGIGSIKGNIGHLFEAAGLASVLKVTLCLEKRMLPPIAGFRIPNAKAGFGGSAVYPLDRAISWEPGDAPRRCGVSSFGLSGTNCHIVLEEPPCSPPPALLVPGRPHLFALSAGTGEALEAMAGSFAGFLKAEPNLSLGDTCFTLGMGRGAFAHRLAIVAMDIPELIGCLDASIALGLGSGLIDLVHFGVVEKPGSLGGRSAGRMIPFRMDLDPSRLDRNAMSSLASAFVSGGELDWPWLYPQGQWKRLRLPLYPFAKTPCWVRLPIPAPEVDYTASLFQRMDWKACPPPVVARASASPLFIVLKSPGGLWSKIAERLREEGATVREWNPEAERGDACEAYFSAIAEHTGPLHIVFGADIASGTGGIAGSWEELLARLEAGVFPLFRAMGRILRARPDTLGTLSVLVPNAFAVMDGEKRVPEAAALLALGRSIARENPGLAFRELDWDDAGIPGRLTDELELLPPPGPIAFRLGKRFAGGLARLELPEGPVEGRFENGNGVCLITGGTGAAGLEVAEYLAENGVKELALLGRSANPEIPGDGKKHPRIAETLALLKAKCVKVTLVSVDISDRAGMTQVIADLRKASGRIRGVVHCAGELRFGLFGAQDEREFRRGFEAKIHGTWLLHHLTRNERDPLDFMILFSSMAGLFPVPGSSSYSVGNAYLDGFGESTGAEGRISVWDWAEWKGKGMAEDFRGARPGLFLPLEADERRKAFDALWLRAIPRALVGVFAPAGSDGHWKTRYPILGAVPPPAGAGKRENNHGYRHVGKPVVIGDGNRKVSATQEEIARVCAGFLGLGRLNVDDNLLEIGADSIILARIHDELQKTFPGRLTISHMFTFQTIARLAAFLDEGALSVEAPAAAARPVSVEDILRDAQGGKLSLGDAVKALMESKP